MSNLKPDDKKDRRKSGSDHSDVSKLFEQKLVMADSIKRFISLKINHEMKKIEDQIADQLISKLLDEIDKTSSEMLRKIGK